jgi:O-antigen ligase
MLITLMIIDNELNVVAEYGKFIILVNFVCMLIWPNGIWRRIYFTANEPVFFIGHKNFLDLFVLFILLFIFLQNKKTSLSYWIYYILSVISVFMSKSSTGTVVMLFSFIISIFYWEKLYKILLNDKLIYIITFIISILITLTPTILTNNRYIQELIIKGFHKDLTLSYRTILWEKAWEYIARSPIIGWGQNLVFREYSNNISNPAHNAMLQVLISTGIVGVVLLFVLYFKCSKRMVDKLDNEKTHIQINLCILMFMLIGIMEPTVLTGHYLFVLMVLQYHSNRNKI